MIFDRFIKPKWQHRKPDIRKTAVEELTDLTILTDIAQNDEVADIRCVATRKITHLELLDTIAKNDTDSQVRELALQRFKQFLYGNKSAKIALEKRVVWVDKLENIELIEHICTHAQDIELRLAAIKKIQRESVLGDIAINEQSQQIRTIAVEKLQKRSTLERVYKVLRNKDKRLSRVVKEKLDTLIAEQERPQRVKEEAEAICHRLLALGRSTAWEQDFAEYNRLKVQWDNIADEVEEAIIDTFTKRKETFLVAYHTFQHEKEEKRRREALYIPRRKAKEACYVALEKVCQQLTDFKQADQDHSEHTQQLTELKAAWQELDPLGDEEEHSWQQRFSKLMIDLEKQQASLENQAENLSALEKLCERVEALKAGNKEVSIRDINQLKQAWTAQQKPDASLPSFVELNTRFNTIIEEFDSRVQSQRDQFDQQRSKLKALVEEAEQKIEKGTLQPAIPLEQKARQLLKHLEELAPHSSKLKSLERRVHAITGKIRDLRSWQRWGDDVERENLCIEMEKLVERADDDPEETARLIRLAQKEWKKLGNTGHSQHLWERFNSTCNKAYAPCQSYFTEKAKEREQNLKEKEGLCERLETLFAETDWTDPDWKPVMKVIRDVEHQWYKIGPTNRKDKKPIKQRFDDIMKRLEQYLAEERENNYQLREDLIEQAKEAQEIEDLNYAIESVKKLQADWHVTVTGSRKEERQLWREFRGACDVIFNRRKEKQEEFKRELNTNLQAKEALCEQVEALVSQADIDYKAVDGQLKKIRTEWQTIGTIPRKVAHEVEKRFHAACDQVNQHRKAAANASKRAVLDMLKQKARLCTLIVEATTEEQQAEIKAQWDLLGTLENNYEEQQLTQRFEQACAGENSADKKAIELCENLCVRMEILAEIDSPPEAAQARMSYQVSRLSAAMSGGKEMEQFKDKHTEAQHIEREWYVNASLPAETAQLLNERFNKALTAFYEKND